MIFKRKAIYIFLVLYYYDFYDLVIKVNKERYVFILYSVCYMRYIDKIKAFYPLEIGSDNKVLRAWWEEVTEFDDELEEFAEILMDLLWEYDGVWLAAPQIWRNIAVIWTTQWKKMPKGKNIDKDFLWETVLVNPKILEKSEEMQESEEACLSLPDRQGYVERHQWVVVEYQDLKGKKKQQKYSWFNACIIQHEVDHLNGILFTDKLIRESKK